MHGNRLQEIRKSSTLTQQEVANALGIERSTFACYEIGKTEPSIKMLYRIMRLFDVTLEEIYPSVNGVADDYEPYNDDKSDVSFSMLSEKEKELVLKFRLMEDQEKQELFEKL